MKKVRVAGLVEMENGYALMHRMNVKKKENSTQPYGDYYVFPGGGLEENETLEEGVKREILEEFGIIVEVKEKLYFRQIAEELDEYAKTHLLDLTEKRKAKKNSKKYD